MPLSYTSLDETTSEEVSKLQRRLQNGENVLLALLAQTATSSGVWADSVIERRLEQLEEAVLEIPSERGALLRQWNTKLVELWKRHAQRASGAAVGAGSKAPNEDSTEPLISFASSSASSDVISDPGTANPKANAKKKAPSVGVSDLLDNWDDLPSYPSRAEIFYPVPEYVERTIPGLPVRQTCFPAEFTHQLAQMKMLFASMRVVDDFPSLEKFLRPLEKAVGLVEPYAGNVPLQETVLGYVSEKLPEHLMRRYDACPKTVGSLYAFLKDLLKPPSESGGRIRKYRPRSDYLEMLLQLGGEEPRQETNLDTSLRCFRCLAYGHLMKDCSLATKPLPPLVVGSDPKLEYLLTPKKPFKVDEETVDVEALEGLLEQVETMLALEPLPSAAEIEYKLSQLIVDVGAIPRVKDARLSDAWTEKVNRLVGRYNAAKVKRAEEEKEKRRRDAQKKTQEQAEAGPKASTSKEGAMATEQGPSTSISLTREELIAKLERAFSRLALVSTPEDLPAIKPLLVLIAKGRRLATATFANSPPPDVTFDSEGPLVYEKIVHFALGKLTVPVMAAYQASTSGKMTRSLPALIAYLRGCIQSAGDATLASAQAAQAKGESVAGKCVYCKEDGHLVGECTRRAMMMCFNCFSMGHKSTRCKGAPMSMEAIMRSI